MTQRRFVTFVDPQGRSCIHKESAPPTNWAFRQIPGLRTSLLWTTAPGHTLTRGFVDGAVPQRSLVPAPGGSVFMLVTLPPDAVYLDPGFDPIAAAAEQAEHMPGIAESMEHDAPGTHRTETVDYAVLLSGDLWLETDTGEVQLRPHDVVVQNGTRHAWRNRSEAPATLAVVLLGAGRVE